MIQHIMSADILEAISNEKIIMIKYASLLRSLLEKYPAFLCESLVDFS